MENLYEEIDIDNILESFKDIPVVPVPEEFELRLKRSLLAEKKKVKLVKIKRYSAVAAVITIGVFSSLMIRDNFTSLPVDLNTGDATENIETPKEKPAVQDKEDIIQENIVTDESKIGYNNSKVLNQPVIIKEDSSAELILVTSENLETSEISIQSDVLKEDVQTFGLNGRSMDEIANASPVLSIPNEDEILAEDIFRTFVFQNFSENASYTMIFEKCIEDVSSYYMVEDKEVISYFTIVYSETDENGEFLITEVFE